MRGDEEDQGPALSYISAAQRVPADHPLRPIRKMTDEALKSLSPEFDRLYSKVGRPSIPPERLLRALLLECFYGIRSERLLMEQLDYNLLFRWFVGLNMLVCRSEHGRPDLGHDGLQQEPRSPAGGLHSVAFPGAGGG